MCQGCLGKGRHTFKLTKPAQHWVDCKSAAGSSNAAYYERPCYDARVHLPDQVHTGGYKASTQRVKACLHVHRRLTSLLVPCYANGKKEANSA